MTIPRRTLLSTAAALPMFAIKRGIAADFQFRFATNMAPEHPMNIRGQQACDRIAAASNGQLSVKLYPDSALGSDGAVLDKLVKGEIEFFLMAGFVMSTVVPKASINGIGYSFTDYGQVWSAMDGKLGAFIREEMAGRGLIAMNKIWNAGFRQTTNSLRQVRTPEDFRGMKVRVPVSPLWTSMFRALGAETTSLDFHDVYEALNNRTVDAQENALAVVQASKFYEVQKFCTLTNHIWDGKWVVANERIWNALAPRHRDIIAAEFERSANEERADLNRMNPELRGDLAETGLLINNVDTDAFRRTLQKAGFYAEQRARYGEVGWKLLQDYVGALS